MSSVSPVTGAVSEVDAAAVEAAGVETAAVDAVAVDAAAVESAGGEVVKVKTRSKAKLKPSEALEIQLEHARWRHFGWMMFGAIAGTLLIWKLGIVGKMLGVVLAIIAGLAAYNFVRTLLNAAGRILIDGDSISLPLGLCRGKHHSDELDNIKHAYFLRRAVPWTRAGPVLVIETGDRSFTYPRDWFASESDQRRIARRVNTHLGRA